MFRPEEARWRQGRRVGRTLYAMLGEQASDVDLLIGMMDSAKLAAEVVLAHNSTLAKDAE